MRVLVDECLPRQMAAELSGHDASTVREQHWLKLRNGILLRAAVGAGFQVFITNDGSLEFQQNIKRIGIAVIVISGVRNRIEDLRPLIPRIQESLKTLSAGQIVRIVG